MANEEQLLRLTDRTVEMIRAAREIASAQFGFEATENPTVVLKIANMMMTRECAELIGIEVAKTVKKG